MVTTIKTFDNKVFSTVKQYDSKEALPNFILCWQGRYVCIVMKTSVKDLKNIKGIMDYM